MKIESVRIKNFKSFGLESGEIKCGDFNVFIGKNNSGKSNVFDALKSSYENINELENYLINK